MVSQLRTKVQIVAETQDQNRQEAIVNASEIIKKRQGGWVS